MKESWYLRYGDGLAWVEAPSGAAAVRPSPNLRRLGDWTDDAHRLVVLPQDAHPDHAGSHGYTRAVLTANRYTDRWPPSRRSRGAETPSRPLSTG